MKHDRKKNKKNKNELQLKLNIHKKKGGSLKSFLCLSIVGRGALGRWNSDRPLGGLQSKISVLITVVLHIPRGRGRTDFSLGRPLLILRIQGRSSLGDFGTGGWTCCGVGGLVSTTKVGIILEAAWSGLRFRAGVLGGCKDGLRHICSLEDGSIKWQGS